MATKTHEMYVRNIFKLASRVRKLTANDRKVLHRMKLLYGAKDAGVGSRGGKSRGPGAGSRYLLWQCKCPKPVKVRHAGNGLDAICNKCKKKFEVVDSSIPPAQNGKP